MSDDVVIVSAARTPVGSFNGAFATTPAHDLGAIAIKAALERAGVEGGQVSEVIMGQILTAAQGQNPARQASIAAGIPVESPAWGVNQLCGSGLRAVALGYQAIVNGDRSLRFILNGSTATRTLSSRFISEFFGSGVQHIAFSCDDIFAAVAEMRARGAGFLDIPDNYYDDLEAKYDLAPETIAALRANEILYDRDGDAEFFQVYTHIFEERFFFEIVQRRNYQGFGAANAAIRLAAQAREVRPDTMPRL